MRLEYLSDCPEFIPTLAKWHHEQWGRGRERGLERRIARLKDHNGGLKIPLTIVARRGDLPLGSASIIGHDMDTQAELSPWLACVFVAPEHRRQGVGSALVQRIAEEARRLGVESLYLYTPDQESFYVHLGWRVRSRELYSGKDVVVMELCLTR